MALAFESSEGLRRPLKRMSRRQELFRAPKPVIAMIHLGALPGTPAAARSLREIEALAA